MPDLTLHGCVTRVKDGDTVVVSLEEGRTVEVRLWGIDAPESDQPHGSYATKAARKAAKGEPCKVIVKDRDRYGRAGGRVVTTGDRTLDLGPSLTHSGYAWHRGEYASGELSDGLEEAQANARQAGRGLWAHDDPAGVKTFEVGDCPSEERLGDEPTTKTRSKTSDPSSNAHSMRQRASLRASSNFQQPHRGYWYSTWTERRFPNWSTWSSQNLSSNRSSFSRAVSGSSSVSTIKASSGGRSPSGSG